MTVIRMAAGLALLAATTIAAPAPAFAAKKSEADASDPNRQICRSKPVVGSRLKRIRECHTAAEWEDLKLQEEVGLRRMQYNGAPGCQQPPCVTAPGGKDTPW